MLARIRKNDTVMVISGKDRGKRGKVERVIPSESRAVVEGVNIIKRHLKAQAMARQGGIVEREAPVHLSKLMLVCTSCGQPTRVGTQVLPDGTKLRRCKKCGEAIEKP